MGRNTSAMKRGWNYDGVNRRLMAMVDGQEAFRLDADAASGTAGAVYIRADLTSATTHASGNTYCARFRVNSTGAKTGGTVHALGARLTVNATSTGTAFNAFGIYTAVGAYATSTLRGIYMYMDTCSTAPSDAVYCMDLGIVGTGLSSVGHFIRMYNHGTDAMRSVFTLDNAAQDIATYLFIFGAAGQLPLSASTTGEAVTQKAACLIGGATRYLHFHSQ